MNNGKIFFTIMVSASFALAAFMPKFTYSGKIKCNGSNINDVSFATMCVTDWDGDGKKDLIVGEFGPNQKIRFYKNSGTNAVPTFTAFTYLQAAGVDIKLSGG